VGSKGRGYREPRRRGFDDDQFSPREERPSSRQSRPFSSGPREAARPPEGPALEATVKWFNSEKGFGFVELADGSGDVFMHIATLQAAGHDSAEPGTTLRVQVGQGQKGRQVTAVLEVTGHGPVPQSAPRPRTGDRERRPAMPRRSEGPATEVTGTVKWFNPDKGFGFVVAEDGGKDVFIHISVVERAGIRALAEGQRVTMMVEQGQKGREAVSISLAA
jgi:cold shock protein